MSHDDDALFLLDDIEKCLVLDQKHRRDAATQLTKATHGKKAAEPLQVRVSGGFSENVDLNDEFWKALVGKPVHALWLALNWSLSYCVDADTIAAAFENSPMRALKFGDANAMGTWVSVDPSIDQRLGFFRGIAQCKALQKLWLNDVTSMKNSREAGKVTEILTGLTGALEAVGAQLSLFEISGGREIDTDHAAILARGLATLTNVETLILTHNSYSAETLPLLLGAIKSPKLRVLDIGYNAFGTAGFKLLTSVQPFASEVLPKLEELRVCRCNLAWDASEAAAAADMAAKAAPLEALAHAASRVVVLEAGQNLKKWEQLQPTLSALIAHPRAGEWREFDLSFSYETVVADGGGRLIADFVSRNPGIERLDMSYLKMTENDQKLVADAIVTNAPKLAYVGVLFGDAWEEQHKETIDEHVEKIKEKSEKYDKK
jgi:hypothetical protein